MNIVYFCKKRTPFTYRENSVERGETTISIEFLLDKAKFSFWKWFLGKNTGSPLLVLRVGGQCCHVPVPIGCFGVGVGASVGFRSFPFGSRLPHCCCSSLWSSR